MNWVNENSYSVRRPSGSRKTYIVVRRTAYFDHYENTTLQMPEIKEINERYRRGELDHWATVEALEEIVIELRKEERERYGEAKRIARATPIPEGYECLVSRRQAEERYAAMKRAYPDYDQTVEGLYGYFLEFNWSCCYDTYGAKLDRQHGRFRDELNGQAS